MPLAELQCPRWPVPTCLRCIDPPTVQASGMGMNRARHQEPACWAAGPQERSPREGGPRVEGQALRVHWGRSCVWMTRGCRLFPPADQKPGFPGIPSRSHHCHIPPCPLHSGRSSPPAWGTSSFMSAGSRSPCVANSWATGCCVGNGGAVHTGPLHRDVLDKNAWSPPPLASSRTLLAWHSGGHDADSVTLNLLLLTIPQAPGRQCPGFPSCLHLAA